MIKLDIRSRIPTKKSDSDSQCCKKSDSTQKSPTPHDSDSGSDSPTLVAYINTIMLSLPNCKKLRFYNQTKV